jgi:hypothetical protein
MTDRAELDRLLAGARHHGVAAPLALARAARLYLAEAFSVREILAYALYDPAVVASYPVLISKERSLAKLARLNPLASQWQTEDKALFYARCARAGLAIPRWFGVIAREGGHDAAGRPISSARGWTEYLAETLPEHFIVKDRAGAYGSGFAAFRRARGGFVDERTGARIERPDLYAWLTQPGSDSLVMQERLFDHPWLDDLAGRPGLQTLRITTRLEEDGNAVRVLFYFMKLRLGDNLADNFASGATGNLIGIGGAEAGRLAAARALLPCGSGLHSIEIHPASGLRLDQRPLPWWPEAVALVTKAHREFREFGALGWDVALTEQGPLLLEANAWWDPPNYAPWIMREADWRDIFG